MLRKSHLVAKHQIDRTRVEKEIMDRVAHPFVMRLHAAFQSENFLFMMLEYCRCVSSLLCALVLVLGVFVCV